MNTVDSTANPKAILILDIDGTINPFFARYTLEDNPERLPNFEEFRINSDSHGSASAFLPRNLLTNSFHKLEELGVELTWGSAWNGGSNLILEMLEISSKWPTIIFPEEIDFGMDVKSWKLSTVRKYIDENYSETVPLIWLDDEIFSDAELWIQSREGGGLMIRPERHRGLSEEDWAKIISFVGALA